jgi:hypothetical protein
MMKHLRNRALGGALLVLLCQCQSVETKADRAKFRAADANGDGKLSLEEARKFEHKRVFDLIDYDQNGSISLQEALDIAPGSNRGKFKEYDLNGDGKVSLAEFEKVQTKKGYVKQRFEAADRDGDGFVTLKEADARVQFLQAQAGGEM